ncbi:hypothetical protein D9757_009046 [Collybiopsis confluens]|uniref:Uncharacterized protein n=1 Tax=Collybiopsis confluens TaxID=2823264 RepID=A0A8H5HDQ1_9AGAR|nr:hypothetical protein D9757_009046 [Collybiopsis confluens]
MHALELDLPSPASVSLVVGSLAVGLIIGWRYIRLHPFGKPSKAVKESESVKQREWGQWDPVLFPYPPINASPNPMDLKPIPYRPFRWGAYHVTMGIREMPWDEWMELDDRMTAYFYIKKHRIATRGINAIRILPDRHDDNVQVKSASQSAIELVHELAQYVNKRYPEAFSVSCDAESGFISHITIVPVNHTFQLPSPLLAKGSLVLRNVSLEEGEEALKIAVLLVQDDLALMVEGTDGRYYFQGGFWRLQDKIGLSLEEIHVEGNVPQYEKRLQVGMNRHFQRMSVDKPVIRNNYSIQVVPPEHVRLPGTELSSLDPILDDDRLFDPEEISWSSYANGPEDTFPHGNRYPVVSEKPELIVVSPENLRMRSERQTLRRLPLTGAIVFAIRTYTFRLQDLATEPGVPARMASAIRSWPMDVRKYKGAKVYEKAVLEYLDRAAEKQLQEGGEQMANDRGNKYPY